MAYKFLEALMLPDHYNSVWCDWIFRSFINRCKFFSKVIHCTDAADLLY